MQLLRSYYGELDSLLTDCTIAVKSTFTPVMSHHNGGSGQNGLKNTDLGSSISLMLMIWDLIFDV